MKKLALIGASLLCFAGCAREDTGDLEATDTSTSTGAGVGAAGANQTGSDMSTSSVSSGYSATNTNTLNTLAPSSSSSSPNLDTNNEEQLNVPRQNAPSTAVPPATENNQENNPSGNQGLQGGQPDRDNRQGQGPSI
jgi:hypothetical protein